MVQPINLRAINQGFRRWPINSTTNLGAGSGLSAYAVNGNDPATVADFAGTLNSGTPYFRVGGSTSSFASMFSFSRASAATYTNSSGNIVSATSGTARTDHYRWNGSSYVRKGILLESAAATNLVTRSNDLANAAWSKASATVTNDALSTSFVPLARLEATANTGYVLQNVTLADSSTYCVSGVAADDGVSWVYVRAFDKAGSSNEAWFNVATGAVGASPTGSATNLRIEEVAAGVYRWSFTFASAAGASSPYIMLRPTATDGGGSTTGDDVFIGAIQVELGSVPTSYIPTSGATATRAAETLTIAGSNMAYSATAMSFHMQGEVNYTDKNDTSECWLMRWYSTSVTNDRTLLLLDTSGALTGGGSINSRVFNPCVETEETQQLTPGINKAFNFAARVTTDGSTTGTVNIASNGTSASGTTNAEDIIADLSNEPCMLFYNDPSSSPSTGTIALFRQADVDWTDTGIEEATS